MIEKKYKYWLIYIKSTDINIAYELYAYTDNKKYMKQFVEERDMNKFIVMMKKLTKNEIHMLTEEFNSSFLIPLEGKTRTEGKKYIGQFSIIATKAEKLNVMNTCTDVIMSKMWSSICYDPMLFKNKYKEMFVRLGYYNAYRYLCLDFDLDYFEDIASEFEPDYLSAFLNMYSDLMKGGIQ